MRAVQLGRELAAVRSRPIGGFAPPKFGKRKSYRARLAGMQEGGQKIELLRARRPKAFPAKSQEVRPLTNGAQQTMVEEFGWSTAYARAVLTVWKLRSAYCQAINDRK
jgi:hypothetical protein